MGPFLKNGNPIHSLTGKTKMVKILSQQELEKYVPGQGCVCSAYSAEECGCPGSDIDWTPKEVYKLRLVLKNIITTFFEDGTDSNCANKMMEIAEEALNKCNHDGETWFDRTLDENGDMHNVCCKCGKNID